MKILKLNKRLLLILLCVLVFSISFEAILGEESGSPDSTVETNTLNTLVSTENQVLSSVRGEWAEALRETPEKEPSIPWKIEGTGTFFEVKDSVYLNATLDSNQPIRVTLESVPEMVAFHIESAAEATSTLITLGGFLPRTTYYKYEDDYHNLETFTTDGTGNYTYFQDLSAPHFVFVQPRPSTIFLTETGWSDPATGIWDPVTRTATLIKHINQTIQIDINNMTLDGNGHTISGSGTGYGVYLSGKTGVTIKSLTTERFSSGIHLQSSNNNILTNNSANSNTGWMGISINYSNNNTLAGNTTMNNEYDGISLSGYSNNNTLAGNTTMNNEYDGISLRDYSNNNTLTGNTVSNNGSDGIGVDTHHNTLTGNTVSNNGRDGIGMHAHHNTLTGNIASNNNDFGIWLGDGSNNNTLENNTTNSNDFSGIHLNYSSNNMLINNTANSNYYNGIGLSGWDSDNNTVTNNTANSNYYNGIGLSGDSDNNTVTNNTASDNYYGIYLSASTSNQIYRNNLIRNLVQAVVEHGSTGNVFNLEKPVGGNFWSDWAEPDDDFDGFVDSPYVFEGGQDNFPWAKQNGWLIVAPTTASEKSFSKSTLAENVVSQKADLTNVTVSGDLESTLNFANFEMITVSTGPFAGQGFSKGQFVTTLGGVSYSGDWEGALFFKQQERRIYLKGSVSGEISGIVEGYLSESIPGTGSYDQYSATWKIGRLGSSTTSVAINLEGRLIPQSSSEYPSTELYLLQTNVEGTTSGGYSGSLDIVLTHLKIATPGNPYYGEGFSAISYTTESGSGEGWTYNKTVSPGRAELHGLFTGPLLGVATATLDETKTPRTLTLTIERIDLGLPPAADLKVEAWGPGRVSPGQTVDYVIKYRNDGLKTAENAMVFVTLDPLVKYVSSSMGASYSEFYQAVTWNLGRIPPGAVGYLRVTTEVPWGLPQGQRLNSSAFAISGGMPAGAVLTDGVQALSNFASYSAENKNLFANGIGNDPVLEPSMSAKFEEFAELVDAAMIPGLYASGSYAQDVADVQGATPGEMYSPNENNGLKWFQDQIFLVKADTVFAFSGGTRTVLTAMNKGYLSCRRLVLISPMSGWGSFGGWKREIEQLGRNHPDTEIILYQSMNDVLLLGEGIYQVKFHKSDLNDLNWLRSNEIKVNPGTREFASIPESFLEVEVEGKSVRIEIDEEEINEKNHAGLFLYINGLLRGDKGESDTSVIATAHDPNIKYGPEGSVSPGEKLDYKVEFENEGEGIAYGVYFTDRLDEDLDDSTLEIGPVISTKDGSVIAPPGTYNPGTRTITWLVGEVGPGEGGYAELSASVRSDVPDGTEIINFGTVYFPSVPEVTRTNGVVSTVRADATPPETSISIGDPKFGTDPTYVTSSTEFSLSATDDNSGVASTEYKMDTGGWMPYAAPFSVLGEGSHTISYRSTDNAGNVEETKTLDVYVDDTPPAISFLNPAPGSTHIFKEPAQLSISVTDEGSGISSYSVTLNGKDITLEMLNPINLEKLGENVIEITAGDNLGNESTASYTFYVTYKVEWLPPMKYIEEYEFFTYSMQNGSTLPIKWKMYDYFGNIIQDPNVSLEVYDHSNLNEVVFYQGLSSGQIRFDPNTGQYIVNLKTGNYSWMTPSTTNYYEVELWSQEVEAEVNLFDPANFQIVEKGKAKGK